MKRSIDMDRKWHSHLSLIGLLVFCLAADHLVYANESTVPYTKEKSYQAVNRSFTRFSTSFIHVLAKHGRIVKYDDINTLLDAAQQAYAQHNAARACSLIIGNMHLLNSNINTTAIIDIEALLLKANELNTAKQLLKSINNESDPSIISNVQYAFAKYYYSRGEWNKTIKIIKSIANDLPTLHFQHAMLMEGISLQNLREHRKSLVVYKKIPADSSDYVAARINMAIANIRQDWWTDGYDILTKLLQDPKVRQNKALADRIHTIIGYTFLQQEYFRNSRQAFRKVELHGAYTEQALLGIALDAGYQKDYVGALNASRILKNKSSQAIQVDDAHLLLPYFYEKLGQLATASAGYTDAIKYYEGRLHDLKTSMATNLDDFRRFGTGNHSTIMNVNGERIDLGEYLPPAFFTQLALLRSYKTDVDRLGKNAISTAYRQLLNRFIVLVHDVVRMELKKKSGYITDYMNQCRYGLARLYDKNVSDTK